MKKLLITLCIFLSASLTFGQTYSGPSKASILGFERAKKKLAAYEKDCKVLSNRQWGFDFNQMKKYLAATKTKDPSYNTSKMDAEFLVYDKFKKECQTASNKKQEEKKAPVQEEKSHQQKIMDAMMKQGADAEKESNKNKSDLPKAGYSNAGMEKNLINACNKKAKLWKKDKVYSKAILSGGNWHVENDPITKKPIKRLVYANMCATHSDGHCSYQSMDFEQIYIDGKWDEIKITNFTQWKEETVPCTLFK